MATIISARCPACQTTIRFTSPPELGAFLVCEECEAELEVIQVRPLKLSWVDDDEFVDHRGMDDDDYGDYAFDDDEPYDDF